MTMRVPIRCHLALPRLFGAALILALLAPWAGAERPARAAAAPPPDDSFISIRFADPAIPPIQVTGVAEARPYGIHYSAEELRARDQVAVALPPPELNAYALEWESRQDFDARLQGLAQDISRGSQGQWGWGDWGGGGWFDFNGWNESGIPANLLMGRLIRQTLHPTPPVALPAYNLPEYRADYAAWRRGLERAALRGARATGPAANGASSPRR
jgi:hypothetical protein